MSVVEGIEGKIWLLKNNVNFSSEEERVPLLLAFWGTGGGARIFCEEVLGVSIFTNLTLFG